LVDWYGKNERLRKVANLFIIAGHINPEHSTDKEEQYQIYRMHDLMDQHGLDNDMRWLGMRLDKNLAGELYRFVADRRGVFVQPALFEAFGLTVIEAMTGPIGSSTWSSRPSRRRSPWSWQILCERLTSSPTPS